MKILIAHKYWFRGGGTTTYLFGLADSLATLGHEVIPFSVAYEEAESCPWSPFFVPPPAGAHAAHLRDLRLTPLTMLKLLGRATYSVESRKKALSLVDAAHPDIAYVHNIYNYMSPSMLHAFEARGLPMVMRVADYNMVCPGLQILRDDAPCLECVERGPKHALRYRCCKGSLLATAARVVSMYAHRWLRVYDLIDIFVTPSLFLKRTLVQAGYDQGKILHLPSFVHLPDQSQPVEQDYVLYLGRIAREKGLEVLVRAFHRLRSSNSVRLVIAGRDCDGETERLQRLSATLGVRGLEFVGLQGPERLHELIAHCLFTVVPSLWYDNSPMAVLESFAWGRPVIGSNIGGIPEQITDQCGLLFEPGNVSELAEKMQILLADAAMRKQMGEAARQRVQEHFSAEKHCARLLDLFERLIDRRRQRA